MERDSRKLMRLLERDGWILAAITGSHHHFRRPGKHGKVTLPHPKHDLPIGTVKAIYKQAGLPGKDS
jgi:predicted RNA binding protein YcfA (HicA-like mRNA interferase family)